MHRRLHHGAIAVMALALPLAALAQTNLNLDTGATGASGGDITFSGTSIAPVGSATIYSLTAAASGSFGFFTETMLVSLPYDTTPIPSGSLPSDLIAVHTNAGNYAKLLVTAFTGSSITLQYVTYNSSGTQIQSSTATLSGSGGPGVPTIAALVNNYGNVNPNAPNYGIAPGALIVIYGTNLAAAGGPTTLQDPSHALPLTLSQSSVSVTVNGTTVHPAFYYAFPGQIAVVIPSNTPVGTGTITVANNGQGSSAFPIKVVASAFGFDYWNGALAAVTDSVTGALITPSNSARPGETVLFWGSGAGANTKNTDVSPPTNFDPVSGITAFYIGGNVVTPLYQGRSSYQGVDQINVTIPANAPTGCAVSVVTLSGNVVSNFVTIPIATSGGNCVDPLSINSGPPIQPKPTLKFGAVMIAQATQPTAEIDNEALASFYSMSGNQLTGYQSSKQPSLGSCFVTQSNSSTPTNPFTLTGLDAGTLSVQGPLGTQPLMSFTTGLYAAIPLPTGFIPAGGGPFVFTGTGGADVGPFTASVNFNTPLVWTNPSSDGTVTRASGVTVTWNGGFPRTYAQISGSSSSGGFSASFVCDAPVSALTFTVPTPVLLALPAGTGSLSVSNYTYPTSVTIPNLDFAYAMGFASTTIDATYN